MFASALVAFLECHANRSRMVDAERNRLGRCLSELRDKQRLRFIGSSMNPHVRVYLHSCVIRAAMGVETTQRSDCSRVRQHAPASSVVDHPSSSALCLSLVARPNCV